MGRERKRMKDVDEELPNSKELANDKKEQKKQEVIKGYSES